MPGRSANSVFDYTTFIADVNAYRSRFNISQRALAESAEIDYRSVNDLITGRRRYDPGLLVVVSIALVCDLNLNKYAVENPSCENCTTTVNKKIVKVFHPIGRPCGT